MKKKTFIIWVLCLTLMNISLPCNANTNQESNPENVYNWDHSTNQPFCGTPCDFLCVENEECLNWKAELRFAAVYPASKKIRRIYNNIEPEVQVEFSGRVYEKIYGWANVGYLWNSGHSLGLKYKTNLDFYTITFGLKYEVDISSNLKAYVGAGAAYGYLRVKNHSDFIRKHFNSDGWGGITKTGIYYIFSENLYFDIFADYLFLTISKQQDFSRNQSFSVNLNGLRVGVGLGMDY